MARHLLKKSSYGRLCVASAALVSSVWSLSEKTAQCQTTIDPIWAAKWEPNTKARPAGRDPGFHQKSVNWVITKHGGQHLKGRVLVPLCGKTVDMPHIAGLPQASQSLERTSSNNSSTLPLFSQFCPPCFVVLC